jgi:hypothetical protein
VTSGVQRARRLYSYTVFSPFDFESTVRLDAWHNHLNAEIGQRPLFIGIEDDMVGVVEEALRDSHATRMRGTFEAYWPTKAPWEV